MSDWREGYRAALGKAILSHGAVPRTGERSQYSSWTDFEATYALAGHKESCAFQLVGGDPTEISLYQFNGTFADDHHVDVVAGEFTCACGRYVGQEVAVETTLSDLIQEVTR